MTEELSRRGYAKHRGVSEAAVRKALSSGRIRIEPSGYIDPRRADEDWDRNTAPKTGDGQASSESCEPPAVREGRVKDDAGESISLIRQVLAEEGHPPSEGPLSYPEVRMALSILQARRRALELRRDSGELVDIEAVAEIVGAEYSTVRALFLSLPAALAPELASIDDEAMIQIRLERAIANVLDQLTAPELVGKAAAMRDA